MVAEGRDREAALISGPLDGSRAEFGGLGTQLEVAHREHTEATLRERLGEEELAAIKAESSTGSLWDAANAVFALHDSQ